jgi:hypothetical protein
MKQLRLLCGYRDVIKHEPKIYRYRLLFVPLKGRVPDKVMRNLISQSGYQNDAGTYSSNLFMAFETFRGAKVFQYRQRNLEDKKIEAMQDWDHNFRQDRAREVLIISRANKLETLLQFSTIGETKQFLKRAQLCELDDFEMSLMDISI